MKNEGYINIQGWMINEHKLKGNDLLLYAIIYGFSQDGVSQYRGSLRYIEQALKISRPTIIRSLDKLIKRKLIFKTLCNTGNLYSVNLQLVKKLNHPENEVVTKRYHGGNKTLPVSGNETLHNI